MSDRVGTRQGAQQGGVRVSLVSAGCLLRGLPLFFSAAPRTPLRVLGIIALDTLHVLRTSRPLTRQKVRALALFLDLEGCANAAWDQKHLCHDDFQAIRHRLEKAGLGLWTEEYLSRLRALESGRPPIGGDHGRFDEVRLYREAVAQLSLGAAAAIALDADCLDEAIRTIQYDGDVDTLVRILLQCQIIDDVIDYQEDLAAGLPSFLTACASLPRAIALTAGAARSYGLSGAPPSDGGVLPLRVALGLFTAVTTLVVQAAEWMHHEGRPSRTMLGER